MNQKPILIQRESVFLTKFCILLIAIQLILLAYFYSRDNLHEYSELFITLFSGAVICMIINMVKNKKTWFLKIEDDFLKISRKQENLEDISIKTNEISYLETKFNKIIIYDLHSTPHTVRLDHIRSEKKRWEIKEAIRRLSSYQQHKSKNP